MKLLRSELYLLCNNVPFNFHPRYSKCTTTNNPHRASRTWIAYQYIITGEGGWEILYVGKIIQEGSLYRGTLFFMHSTRLVPDHYLFDYQTN